MDSDEGYNTSINYIRDGELMADLYIDPDTGDLALQNNMVRLTAGNDELTRQRIETTLRTFRGEWVYNILEGIPYLENKNNKIQLIGRAASKEDFDSYIKQAILNKPFVTAITFYESSLDRITKKLSIRLTVAAGEERVNFNTEL